MLCRFCGKHIDSDVKCNICSKETPVLLEYKSYENDSIIEKISPLLEVFSSHPIEEAIDAILDNQKISEIPEAIDETSFLVGNTQEQIIQPQIHKNGISSKKNIFPYIISVGTIAVLTLGVYFGIDKYKKSDLMETSPEIAVAQYTMESSVEMKKTETTTGLESTIISTVKRTVPNVIINDIDIDGKYYSINGSIYNEIDRWNDTHFRDIFGQVPDTYEREIFIKDNCLLFNSKSYNFDYDDDINVLNFKSSSFSDMGEDFIDIFNFSELVQSGDYNDNNDKENNQLVAFKVEDKNVNTTILCNRLEGLSYDKPKEMTTTAIVSENDNENNVTTTTTILNSRSITESKNDLKNDDKVFIFSITKDNGKEAVSCYKDKDEMIYLKTSYKDNLDDKKSADGEILRTQFFGEYTILRILLDEKQKYFLKKEGDSSVYMIQYIKYNPKKESNSNADVKIQDTALIRNNKNGVVK